jgi:branched-subunit amino acid aminotransferase/4-amino-4-deoxychorismate lyase
VAGVMRRHIMEKIAVKEKSLAAAELLQADEIFFSNAIKKMRWVSHIDQSDYTNEQIKNIYTRL